MLEKLATSPVVASAAREAVRQPQPQGASNKPDAPAREVAAVVRASLSAEATQARQETQNGDRAQASSASVPAAAPSALTTYKDSESGRLIIRIFDKETGDVLLEFPPEDPPLAPSFNARQPDGASITKIDV